MPCYDDRPDVMYANQDGYKRGLRESQLHINKLTRLLCTAMREYTELGSKFKGIYPHDKELADWWDNHQKIDRARAARKDRRYLSKRK